MCVEVKKMEFWDGPKCGDKDEAIKEIEWLLIKTTMEKSILKNVYMTQFNIHLANINQFIHIEYSNASINFFERFLGSGNFNFTYHLRLLRCHTFNKTI